MFRNEFKQVSMLFLIQISERLTLKVGQLFNRLISSNPFLGTVIYAHSTEAVVSVQS